MKVELLNYFGNDLMVANAARVSYGKSKEIFDEKDIKLLKYLKEHKHTSVFRHPQFQFRIQCAIFVERQLMKHQVGMSANCLHGDSFIRFKRSSGTNEDIKIKDLYNQWTNGRSHQNTEKDREYVRKRMSLKKIRVMNENTGEFTTGNIKNIFYSGKKPVFVITCQNGESIKCSSDHKVWTKKGWKTINSGLSTADFIGLNGVNVVGNGGYRDYNNLKQDRDNLLSVNDMANKYGCSYHTIRKWLKNYGLQFSKLETYFKKGDKPWNKDCNGYTLNLSDEGRAKKGKNVLKGSQSHFWRGGITDERAKIGQWTRKVAGQVHKKYNYTCQNCGGDRCLHAHHMLPVCTHPEEAYNIKNLITVCRDCHHYIHKNKENEREFARKFLSEFEILDKKFGKNKVNRKGRRLSVHFSKIVSIVFIGDDDTYDIEIDGPHHNFVANGIVVHNSISGRYVDFSDEYWIPEQLRFQSKDSKQGSAGDLNFEDNQYYIEKIKNHIEQSKILYKELEEKGVAKELCRIILPLTLETQFIWTGSLLAFLHFWNLRIKPDVQKETMEIAQEMLKLVKEIPENPFQYTLEAFGL